MLHILRWTTAVAYVALGVGGLVSGARRGDRGYQFPALGLALYGVVAVLNLFDTEINPRYSAITAVSVFVFLGSALALLLFRDVLIPLSSRTKRVAFVATVLCGVTAAIVQLPPMVSPTESVGQYVVLLLIFVVWTGSTIEPMVRLWMLSRERPAIQRARLRALSLGYASINVALLTSVGASAVTTDLFLQLVAQIIALAVMPVLAVTFLPPPWLRRLWRDREEAPLREALFELLRFSPSQEALAEKALPWALRLVGADGGFIADPHGKLLASTNIPEQHARELISVVSSERERRDVPGTTVSASAVAIPLFSPDGVGTLAVLPGPFTPLVGSHERVRLQQYATAISAALERVTLVDEKARTERRLQESAYLLREQETTERALRQSEDNLRTVLNNVADGIVIVSDAGSISSFNLAAERLFGYANNEVIGRPIEMLFDDPQGDTFTAHYLEKMRIDTDVAVSEPHEINGRHRNGDQVPIELTISAVWIGNRVVFVTSFRDIAERRAQTDALRHQALHDALTGLPNRTLLSDRLHQAIATAHRDTLSLGLLMVDMDRFKEVNDTLGHDVGDVLLQQIAQRLRTTLRESDTISRLGGDEFAILPAGSHDGDSALRAAKKIRDALSVPFHIGRHIIVCEGSIGIALFPEHGRDAATLLRHADIAMYHAKKAKAGYILYAEEYDDDLVRRGGASHHQRLAG